jgi:hypothetical protein
MFDAFKSQIDLEDVVRDVLAVVRCNWSKYNPKYQPSTFVQTIAYRHIVTIYRKLERIHRFESGGSLNQPDESGETMPVPAAEAAEDMHEFVERMYSRSQEIVQRQFVDPFGTVRRKGVPANRGHFPRDYSVPQLLTLMALHQRLQLSHRAMIHYLKENPDVCRAMRLPRIPDQSAFARLNATGARLRLASANRNN